MSPGSKKKHDEKKNVEPLKEEPAKEKKHMENIEKSISINKNAESKVHEAEMEISKLKKELEEAKEKCSTYYAHMQHIQADFENCMKIAEREKAEIIKNANITVIKKMLPVLDDIEAAVKSAENKKDRDGIEIILRNLMKILEEFGLKKIETAGRKFDPYYHDVLMKEQSDAEEGTITGELQKGYMLNSIVIRHSKVKISGGN